MQAARGASLSERQQADEPDETAGPGERPQPPPTSAPSQRLLVLLLGVAATALALDVLTKVLVVSRLEGGEPMELLGGQLLLRVSRNPGAAFSFAEGATVLFTAVAVAVILVILRVARRLGSRGWALALGLLLGGAAGNLVDRVFRSPGPGRGAVVDFIDFQVWPSFNVADSAIVVGGVLAVLLSLRGIEIDGSGRREQPS